MHFQLFFVLALLNIQAVVLDDACSQKETTKALDDCKKKILSEVEKIEKLTIVSDSADKVASKLNKLLEILEEARMDAESENVDINTCLNLDYIYNIPNIVQVELNACNVAFQDEIDMIYTSIDAAIEAINKCGYDKEDSCKKIKDCCKDVVKDFKKNVIDDDLKKAEDKYKKCVKTITQFIDKEIKLIKEAIDKCIKPETSTEDGYSSTTG
ncbi:hypothetical protein FQR65_LT12606 [Abscondita terminalis]|nr:hypothetical protein FQR65_LT12606 [Abscondita terminalis]